MDGEKLWREYLASKDPKLRHDLIMSFLWLVKQIAGRLELRYSSRLSREDLEGYGLIGLIDAVEKFNPGKGMQFEYYAATRIKGAILDEIRKQNWVPRSTWTRLKHYYAVKEELERETGEEAGEEKVAAAMNIPLAELHKLTSHTNKISVLSLDAMGGVKDDGTLHGAWQVEDYSCPDPLDLLEREEDRAILIRAINGLEQKDKLVLALYYQEGLTLKEIGKVLAVSESRVCQLHARAIQRLKKLYLELAGGRKGRKNADNGGVGCGVGS
ncbi:MAG: FliA/WhiG family RNA polymerase sigma factor [Firmicutes bacterium]|nr:FliA/WhiG family RNA polymerase sigma factor [Bacillota bacterium]